MKVKVRKIGGSWRVYDGRGQLWPYRGTFKSALRLAIDMTEVKER